MHSGNVFILSIKDHVAELLLRSSRYGGISGR